MRAILAALALAAALLPAAAPAQRIDIAPIRLTERVWYFRGDSRAASRDNHGFMSNAGFVVTDGGVVVFDALGTPALGEAMIRAIRRVTHQPIRRVIVSHYHADHFYGLQAFEAIGAEVWAHARGQDYLASDTAKARHAQRQRELWPWVDEDTRLVPADRWLDFPPSREIAFALGGVEMKLIEVGGAHAPDDLMLWVEPDRLLFAGDLFFTGRIPFVGEADSRAWLAALEPMLRLEPAVVVPGHGEASREPARDIALTREYLRFLREKMGEAARDLVPFDEAYAAVDWSRFSGYPAFEAANRVNAYGTYLLMEAEALKAAK